jgi:hypothetical protein
MPATSAHALAEALTFFRRHMLPARAHARPQSLPNIRAMKATAKVSEQNPAEGEQPDSLPEGNLPPSKYCRQIPIPQMHHHFTANENKKGEHERGSHGNPFSFSHISVPHFFINSS